MDFSKARAKLLTKYVKDRGTWENPLKEKFPGKTFEELKHVENGIYWLDLDIIKLYDKKINRLARKLIREGKNA